LVCMHSRMSVAGYINTNGGSYLPVQPQMTNVVSLPISVEAK
jgi:hypothetical protein